MTAPPPPSTPVPPSEPLRPAPTLPSLPAAAAGETHVSQRAPPPVTLSGPLVYVSGSGADIFPEWTFLKRQFGRLFG
jgi:hypothetical protein